MKLEPSIAIAFVPVLLAGAVYGLVAVGHSSGAHSQHCPIIPRRHDRRPYQPSIPTFVLDHKEGERRRRARP